MTSYSKQDNHAIEIESYINGNISGFKGYISKLSKSELLECTRLFVEDYEYSIQKMIWLLN